MQTVRMTPVVGLPQLSGWSQVVDHAISPELHLVCSVALSGEAAGTVGREVVSQVLDSEPHSAQELYETLENILVKTPQDTAHIALIVGLFIGERCFCAAVNGSVLLKRGEKIGVILQAGGELKLMEGKTQLNDVFVLATAQAEQFLSQIELQFQKGFDTDGVITNIVPAVHSLPDSSQVALAFVSAFERSASSFGEHSGDGSLLETVESVVMPHAGALLVEELGQTASEPQQAGAVSLGAPVEQTENRRFWSLFIQKVLRAAQKLPRIFSQKTYVDAQLSRRVYRWLLVGAIIVGVIGVTIFFLIFSNRKSQQAADALVAPYQEKLQKLEEQARTNPIPTREQANQLVGDLTKLQAEQRDTGTKKAQQAVGTTLARAQALYTSISGKEEFSELPIFYDLRLGVPNFVSSLTTVENNVGIFIDNQSKELVALHLDSKEIKERKLDSFSQIHSVSPLEADTVAVLAEGVFSVPVATDDPPGVIKEVGDSNRNATLVNTFGTYVYILNPEKRNIFRYVKSKTGYSDPVGWLQDPLGVDFTSVTSMAIDGDLWIATNQGVIKKFTTGKVAAFSISGLPEKFETPITLFTRDDVTNLYILEPAKHRLVILDKQGQFIREVKSNSLASATGMFVSEGLKKAFVVSGSIVYELAL